jgi:TetR/AcrR family transcriptional regulator, copper-responsive repressor
MARTGRPRTFDRNEALKQALYLFWNYGYESTSLSQLKASMGNISSPSFYAAFGSKESLFKEACQYYIDHYATVTEPLWDDTLSSKDAIEKTLKQSLDMQYDSDHPLGCMVVLTTMMAPSLENQHVTEILKDSAQRTHQGFIHTIQRGIKSGEFSKEIDIAGLAALLEGFLIGLSSLARNGVAKSDSEYGIGQLLKLLV